MSTYLTRLYLTHSTQHYYPVLCRIWIFEVTGTLGVLAEDKVVIATISSSATFQAALPSDEPVIIPRKKKIKADFLLVGRLRYKAFGNNCPI